MCGAVEMINRAQYDAVIGLEVHAQLLTRTKMFCSCSTDPGLAPNAAVCPVCLGLPGALPVANREAVRLAAVAALALESEINRRSAFARKNYFYPDLPKGYQISQYEQPLAAGGRVTFVDQQSEVTVGIERIHLEEDAGKSLHLAGAGTGVDFNRCGVPLLEIVSAPVIASARQAHLYLTRLKQILEYAGVCAGNMELGNLRCDANVSVRKAGQVRLGTKTELKNLNSFKGVEHGLDYEIERQIGLLEEGERVRHQTLLWDAGRQVTVLMRTKEEVDDYRYFPEPDLVPVVLETADLEAWKRSLPELPHARERRLAAEYGIPAYDAAVLAGSAALADLFEATARLSDDPKGASNWIMTEVLKALNQRKVSIEGLRVTPADLAELLGMVKQRRISGKIAKEVFAEMIAAGRRPGAIVEERGLFGINDPERIRDIARRVVGENPSSVADYRRGKQRAFRFLVGKVMEATGGRADPEVVRDSLEDELGSK
jgi:aspartyl-tRNA(Asn)/glutamyl-tRNA(Gln) amidotransferase subunit B